MRERRQIIKTWHDGSAAILVTLVRVQGSSYREPGARLVISKDGSYEGSISAGCLEADLLRKAVWLVRDGSAIERYSTLFDETAEIPFGLGCGGVLDVLIEPVETPECQALLRAMEDTLSGREHLVATWLPADGSVMLRAVFRANGELIFASNAITKEALIEIRARCMRHDDSEIDGVFMERLVPPQRLVVFGAGDDAKPLVTMACLLGWSVTVVDGRAHLATKSRFPESDVAVSTVPKSIMQRIDSRDAVVIMTHSYEQDRDYLAALLPLQPRYLGLLGSRQRSAMLISDAAAKLDVPVSECCERICAPIGLDLGGEGPEAIALAILAEAQACCTGKQSESRKLSAERVEQYLAVDGSRSYADIHCTLDTI